jgi:hypothetical protein
MPVIKEALSAQSLVCMEKLKALNLSPIAAYLINPQNGYGWHQQQAFRAIRRYKTFLFVSYLYPNMQLIPTQDVDRVWHCHLLHTRKYRQDCELLFGYFIDHEPESEFWGEANQTLDTAFAQTQALMALFEQCFETDTAEEMELRPTIGMEIDRERFPSENMTDTGNLHIYRSACGRPQQMFARSSVC